MPNHTVIQIIVEGELDPAEASKLIAEALPKLDHPASVRACQFHPDHGDPVLCYIP